MTAFRIEGRITDFVAIAVYPRALAKISHPEQAVLPIFAVGFPFGSDRAVRGRRSALAPALRPLRPVNDVRSSWHFDRAAALERLDHDHELLLDIVEQFVGDAPASLAAIDAAIQQGDGPALGDAAHALKGAAGYLAADEFCVAAQALEGYGRANLIEQARRAWPSFERAAHGVLEALRAEIRGA